MNTPSALPAALYAAPQLLPLAPRLPGEEVRTLARILDRLDGSSDPRLEGDPDRTLDLILGQARVLTEWPDKTLAWVVFSTGRGIGECIDEAYNRGRARLEQLYMAAQPVAGCA